VIPVPKGNAEPLDIRIREFRLFGKKLLDMIKKCAHCSKISLYADIGFLFISFGHFVIGYSNLFRISIFDIRILSEYDFSFRH
jgi:hypothetical protein